MAGLAKAGVADEGFSITLVSWALTATTPANKASAQSKLNVFMAGEFSILAAKSHARNYSLFIERVMRLEPDLRARRRMKIPRMMAAPKNTAPIASALRLSRSGFSGGDGIAFVMFAGGFVSALVCTTVLAGRAAVAFVSPTGTTGGVFVGFGTGGGFVPMTIIDDTTAGGGGGGGG
jgi:hypothetical protein